MRLMRGDRVRVLTGKERGKEGEVTRVMPASGKVMVDGVNIAKRHTKPRRATMQGGIIDKHMPIDASNVAVLCSSCGPTRIGYKTDAEGEKLRVCRRCGGEL